MLNHTTAESSLGRVLVARTQRGVSAVLLGDDDALLEADLALRFPRDARRQVPADRWVEQVVACVDGLSEGREIPLDLQGTSFQLQVWKALREVRVGERLTYGDLAARLGRPATSARAIATACAANPAAILVPCHRIVRSDGGISGYRWGVPRKRALLERERPLGEGAPRYHEGRT